MQGEGDQVYHLNETHRDSYNTNRASIWHPRTLLTPTTSDSSVTKDGPPWYVQHESLLRSLVAERGSQTSTTKEPTHFRFQTRKRTSSRTIPKNGCRKSVLIGLKATRNSEKSSKGLTLTRKGPKNRGKVRVDIGPMLSYVVQNKKQRLTEAYETSIDEQYANLRVNINVFNGALGEMFVNGIKIFLNAEFTMFQNLSQTFCSIYLDFVQDLLLDLYSSLDRNRTVLVLQIIRNMVKSSSLHAGLIGHMVKYSPLHVGHTGHMVKSSPLHAGHIGHMVISSPLHADHIGHMMKSNPLHADHIGHMMKSNPLHADHIGHMMISSPLHADHIGHIMKSNPLHADHIGHMMKSNPLHAGHIGYMVKSEIGSSSLENDPVIQSYVHGGESPNSRQNVIGSGHKQSYLLRNPVKQSYVHNGDSPEVSGNFESAADSNTEITMNFSTVQKLANCMSQKFTENQKSLENFTRQMNKSSQKLENYMSHNETSKVLQALENYTGHTNSPSTRKLAHCAPNKNPPVSRADSQESSNPDFATSFSNPTNPRYPCKFHVNSPENMAIMSAQCAAPQTASEKQFERAKTGSKIPRHKILCRSKFTCRNSMLMGRKSKNEGGRLNSSLIMIGDGLKSSKFNRTVNKSSQAIGGTFPAVYKTSQAVDKTKNLPSMAEKFVQNDAQKSIFGSKNFKHSVFQFNSEENSVFRFNSREKTSKYFIPCKDVSTLKKDNSDSDLSQEEIKPSLLELFHNGRTSFKLGQNRKSSPQLHLELSSDKGNALFKLNHNRKASSQLLHDEKKIFDEKNDHFKLNHNRKISSHLSYNEKKSNDEKIVQASTSRCNTNENNMALPRCSERACTSTLSLTDSCSSSVCTKLGQDSRSSRKISKSFSCRKIPKISQRRQNSPGPPLAKHVLRLSDDKRVLVKWDRIKNNDGRKFEQRERLKTVQIPRTKSCESVGKEKSKNDDKNVIKLQENHGSCAGENRHELSSTGKIKDKLNQAIANINLHDPENPWKETDCHSIGQSDTIIDIQKSRKSDNYPKFLGEREDFQNLRKSEEVQRTDQLSPTFSTIELSEIVTAVTEGIKEADSLSRTKIEACFAQYVLTMERAFQNGIRLQFHHAQHGLQAGVIDVLENLQCDFESHFQTYFVEQTQVIEQMLANISSIFMSAMTGVK